MWLIYLFVTDALALLLLRWQVAHDNVRDLKQYLDASKWEEGERQHYHRKRLRDIVIEQDHSVSALPKLKVSDLGTQLYPEHLKRPFMLDNVIDPRSEEHTSELQSLMRTSYAVFRLKKKNIHTTLH